MTNDATRNELIVLFFVIRLVFTNGAFDLLFLYYRSHCEVALYLLPTIPHYRNSKVAYFKGKLFGLMSEFLGYNLFIATVNSEYGNGVVCFLC